MSILAPVLIGLAVLLAAANVYLFFRSRPTRKDEPIYHLKCPGCRRRLRYRARQVGNAGMCPRCRRQMTFPAPKE